MRTKTIVTGFKNSQKIRVILNGVILYTTIKDVMFNLFGQTDQRIAVTQGLQSLAYMRAVESIKPIGLTGTWSGCSVQVDLI